MVERQIAGWKAGSHRPTGWLDLPRLVWAIVIAAAGWLVTLGLLRGFGEDTYVRVGLGAIVSAPFLLLLWYDVMLAIRKPAARRLAYRMIAEAGREEAEPVRLFLVRGMVEIGSDVGYVTFDGAMFVFTGSRTSFRLHRDSIEKPWGMKVSLPEGKGVTMFVEPLSPKRAISGASFDRYTRAFVEWENSTGGAVDEVLPPIQPGLWAGLGCFAWTLMPRLRSLTMLAMLTLVSRSIAVDEFALWQLALLLLPIALCPVFILVKQRNMIDEMKLSVA